MLNKKNRIGNRKLIEKLLKKGRQYKNNHFIFRFLPSAVSSSQFAVIISKKTAPKATERNRLKRQINESLRLNINSFKKDIVAVIIAKSSAIKISYNELNGAIMDFCNQFSSHVE